MTIRIGTAPVSYGFYGAAGEAGGVEPEHLLATMRAAGYQGTELGPPGLMGSPGQLAARAAEAGMVIVGGYVPLHLGSDAAFTRDLAAMNITLDELDATAPGEGLVILADAGTPELMANPARSWNDRALALNDGQWRELARRLQQAIDLAESRGLPTSFHPHISTYVESAWEVERLLALTSVDLTLDTGHLYLAGASAAECMSAWAGRINHVHVKDAHVDVLREARDAGNVDFDSWWDQVCCPLGEGDVDLEPFLEAMTSSGFSGWVVVEQDRSPATSDAYHAIGDEQHANRQWLDDRLDAAR